VRHLPEQFTKHSVVVNGTRIAVAVGGTGKPLLLLHGWPQTADAWNKVMGPLAARGWKVIAPDLGEPATPPVPPAVTPKMTRPKT
jgi:hypothetical protein